MDRLIAPNTVVAGQADVAPATGTPGYATDGDPATGTPATLWPAYQYNSIQEELIAILTAAGITPDRTINTQIASAIKRLVQKTVVLVDTGVVNVYSATNTPPLTVATWVDGTVQQVKIANSNTGASTYAPDGLTAIPIYGLGLQPLQGRELTVGGTAVLMRATIAGINSGNPICVLMECAGGAQQVAQATQSQHAPQMAQVAGVVGSMRNGKMYVAAASATAAYTADEIVVETVLGGIRYCLANFNKTINLAATGAGGMDTGSAPANGYVGLYAIYNPTTTTQALLAVNATSAAAPSVYGGANMPTGYTASALLTVVPTNGSGQFAPVLVRDRNVGIPIKTALTTNTVQGTLTSLSIASIVPQNAISVAGELSIASTSTSTVALTVASDANPLYQQNTTASVGTTGYVANYANVFLSEPQTIYWGSSNSVGTPTYKIYISSYTV
ncbi:hypothetical protein [Burkholderia vietnamiensis]|uniref:hypothetical protein n=1 Tax=Burkholderia vietnamiensis TaxID=60552 RepID=UPI001FCA46E5|nr:hypothetical protein [Burkholderia vietnamiensis]